MLTFQACEGSLCVWSREGRVLAWAQTADLPPFLILMTSKDGQE